MFPPTATGLFWGAVFTLLLLVAAVVDIRQRRIPNSGVLALLISGLVFSLTTRPLVGALSASLLGCLLGFGLFIAFWPMGLIGAGDVKLFAAIGVWLGPAATWQAALIAAIVGGVMALYSLARTRQVTTAIRRIALAVSSRSAAVLAPPPGDASARSGHVPYGVAMATGALVVAWLSPDLALQ
jgi:prepilin peptidase CpaA